MMDRRPGRALAVEDSDQILADAHERSRQGGRLPRDARTDPLMGGEHQETARLTRQIQRPAVAVGNNQLGLAAVDELRI